MTDKELLEELRDQRTWWEKELKVAKERVVHFETELEKCIRLIEVFESKTKEQ